MSHSTSVNVFYQKWRLIKDQLIRYGVVAGGLGVIVAILLIFFYLLYVVFPLFLSANVEAHADYSLPEQTLGKTLFMAMEEQNEIAVRFTDQGKSVFFDVKSGKTLLTESFTVPEDVHITSFNPGRFDKGVVIYGLSDGRVLVAKHKYKISYPNDVRKITPILEFPLGNEPVQVAEPGEQLTNVAIRHGEEQTTIIAQTEEKLYVTNFAKEDALFADEDSLRQTESQVELNDPVHFILLDKEQRNVYLLTKAGALTLLDISDKETPQRIEKVNVLKHGDMVTSVEFLTGELSLLIGDSTGLVSQWSIVRDDHNQLNLTRLRQFKVSESSVMVIAPEQRRKGFVTTDILGYVGIYHSTAERKLINQQVRNAAPVAMALSPRANAFLLETESGRVDFWHIDNEHPDVSWSSIWGKVWYESYPKPDYIWQSSSASNDFEPKMSLTPLVFGTLKAAFYAMIVAIPLALMGAIYTAYFMAPEMRQLVKPSIEIMEALPTVILGFLAGLWLAPFVEENLVGMFSFLVVVPVSVILFAYFWRFILPKKYQQRVPEGWDAAVLVPVLIISTLISFAVSPTIETWFFSGNMQIWMSRELGVGYDQRNSLVVGIAMGFAVIPTIFSIAEDAIFSVPKHLTTGSLALGATPWQTMTKVVLLTASPGIFSAVMIGFGRAVGETMIVLMATGNTPVMDLSIFQGMRTLSANIAVEMPESEVDSTHYRVLFLAALVLFMFTFVFNTAAELVRQNLRQKYSSL